MTHESTDPLGRDNGLRHPRSQGAELRAVGLDGSPLHFLVSRRPGIGPLMDPEPQSAQPAHRLVPVLGIGRSVRKLLVDEPIDIVGGGGNLETGLCRSPVIGVKDPEWNQPAIHVQLIDQRFHIGGNLLDQGAGFRSPVPMVRSPVLTIPVGEVPRGGAQDLGRLKILVPADVDHIIAGPEGTAGDVPAGERVDPTWATGEHRGEERTRMCCQEAPTAQGQVVQMRRHRAESPKNHARHGSGVGEPWRERALTCRIMGEHRTTVDPVASMRLRLAGVWRQANRRPKMGR